MTVFSTYKFPLTWGTLIEHRKNNVENATIWFVNEIYLFPVKSTLYSIEQTSLRHLHAIFPDYALIYNQGKISQYCLCEHTTQLMIFQKPPLTHTVGQI